MVRQMIKDLVWDEGADAYFEAGEGEKTTMEELRLYAFQDTENKTQEQLEEEYAEQESLISEADVSRCAILKRLALRDDGGITGEPGDDGFEGFTEDELRDCTFMDGLTREELEGLLARAEGAIREATNQRASALKRLALMS